MKYIGEEIGKYVEDAKYTGATLLTYPKETVLPYLKSYEPKGGEQYCIYTPKESTGRNGVYFAVINGKIVAAGLLMKESTANVYQLIKDTRFVDYEPLVVDVGTEGTVKDLIWSAQNGLFDVRVMSVGSDDYKSWVMMNYCYKAY